MRKTILTFSIALVMIIILTGCLPRPTDSGPSDTAAPTTSSIETVETSGGPTTGIETGESSSATTGSGTEPSTTEPTTTEPEPEIFYQPLPGGETLLIDLNGDGRSESILYDVFNSYSFMLLINGTATQREGENFLNDWFFLVDLDIDDTYLDLAIQELGPSDDYHVTFFFYNGSRLVSRGVVPGTICDPYAANIGLQEYGLGSIRLDGKGGLVADARGAVLHTWYYEEPWQLDAGGRLQKVPQPYVPMAGHDPETGLKTPETAVVLKLNLPLYSAPGQSTTSLLARAGDSASLIRTDNVRWIELRTQSGETGWFSLGSNPYSVVVGDREYFSEEVFSGLWFAD